MENRIIVDDSKYFSKRNMFLRHLKWDLKFWYYVLIKKRNFKYVKIWINEKFKKKKKN